MHYLDDLRRSERTSPHPAESRSALQGLLPASISHEGYAAKPMHSYWDNFWALKGYAAAIHIAAALGESEQAAIWRHQLDEFERDVAASLLASTSQHRIDYLPGAAELGDFDPASSTIAFAPGGDTSCRAEATDTPDFRALLARVRGSTRRSQGLGRLHALRVAHGRHVRAPRVGASALKS